MDFYSYAESEMRGPTEDRGVPLIRVPLESHYSTIQVPLEYH